LFGNLILRLNLYKKKEGNAQSFIPNRWKSSFKQYITRFLQ